LSGKKKTTMAKLKRESKLREHRLETAARTDARRQDAANGIDRSVEDVVVDELGAVDLDQDVADLDQVAAAGPVVAD